MRTGKLIVVDSFGLAAPKTQQLAKTLETLGVDGRVLVVTGAGDTVVASVGLAMAAGATMEEAAQIANIAGGLVVMKMGTATVSRQEVLRAIKEACLPV